MLKLISNIANYRPIQNSFMRVHRNPHILYYHMVRKDRPSYYYQQPITPDDFSNQLAWLLKNGFEFVPLGDLKLLNSNKKLVAMTTDDGFVENYTVVAPILAKYGIKATFFLIGNCIDNKDLMWVNKLCVVQEKIGRDQLDRQVRESLYARGVSFSNKPFKSVHAIIPMEFKEEIANDLWSQNDLPPLEDYLDATKPYLTHAQVDGLIQEGHSVGAHTLSHPRCNELSTEQLKSEVVGSVEQLRNSFSSPVEYFAYPFGLRPDAEIEREIFSMARVNAFLGTKNSDAQLNGSPTWERDKMEQPLKQSLFWFSVVPVLRKYILRPMRIYM